MFLFTTPNTPQPAPPASSAPAGSSAVVDAIRQGAEASGADFDYLLQTAKRESALDPTAKAPTSSATGLFQFIEQTWLGLVKSEGERLGLGAAAQAVTARPDGTFTVSDPAARQQILKLREEPRLAATLAGALTRQNRDALKAATGRDPSRGELYMAHVLGSSGAADLIGTASSDPTRPAAADFGDAARANRGIFYERGRARSAAEVYGVLAAAQAGSTNSQATVAAFAPAAPAVTVTAQPPGLQGLFQTGARTGPLSDAVARIWRTNNAPAVDARRSTFFPHSGAFAEPASATTPVAEAPPVEVALASAVHPITLAPTAAFPSTAPLPPTRPRFGGQGLAPAPVVTAARALGRIVVPGSAARFRP